ncbi:MAG: GNAT family N-acetyltransferase [Anaerolineales bacterium]
MIETRPFQQDDWNVLLNLANQAVPVAAQENADWLESRKAVDESQRLRRHYVATQSETPVGYGCLEQQSDTPQSLRVYVVSSPANLQGEVGTLLYARLLQDARGLKAASLWAREFQDDEFIREFFTSRGFVETQRFTLPNQPPMVVFTLSLAM